RSNRDWSSDVCSSDLGEYKFTESKVPAGVILAENTREFTVSKDNFDMENPDHELSFKVENEYYDTILELEKVDLETKKPLKGVEIGRASCRERVKRWA